MRYVLAVDQGTTSTRAVIFDHHARIIATDQREHDQIFLAPGWVEHDALQILARTESVIVGAMAAAGIGTDRLAAVGITNQRETSLLWDRRTGKPLANAIVWQDTRTLDICSNLAARLGQNGLRAKTGLPISTYFSAPKIRWLFEHLPEATERCRRGDWLFGTIDSWLVWNLTGEHVTDVTNASRTLLMNLDTLDWDEELLEVFQLPRQMLPRIVPSSQTIAMGRGLLEGVPVAAILGDQQAALFGQVCFDPGAVKCTYGTGGFLLLNCGTTPKSSSHGLITTVAYKLGCDQAHYALEGSVAIAGAAVQWLRDGLGIIRTSADIEELARSVPDNGGVYFVPAFNGLYAPYWREDARGAILGLTRYANRGHLARATLEATAYQTQEVLEAMKQDSNLDLCVLRADGGMVQNRLLMQFQADISRVRVEIPRVTETTALGAAYAAGLATGYWKDLKELSNNWSEATHYEPQTPEEDRTSLLEKWHKAVNCSLGWAK